MFRRRVVHLLLALLLLSQYTGLSHVITHLVSDITASRQTESGTPDRQHLPNDMRCAECLTFTALGFALPAGAPPLFAALSVTRVVADIPAIPLLPAATRLFDSRGPPLVL